MMTGTVIRKKRSAEADEILVPDLAHCIGLRCELPPGEVEWLRAAGERRRLPRGGVFCGIGQSRHEVGFVQDGIMQVYALSAQGKRAVLDFLFPGAVALALRSAVAGTPSDVCFEAVTPCTLLVWPYDLRHAAFARHPEWQCLEARLAQEAFVRKRQQDLSFRVRDAAERYVMMVAELPDAGRRIPQHLLASYLGITPQYLSRLNREAQERLRPARRKAIRVRQTKG